MHLVSVVKTKTRHSKYFSRGQNRLILRVAYELKENTSPPPRKWILNSLLRRKRISTFSEICLVLYLQNLDCLTDELIKEEIERRNLIKLSSLSIECCHRYFIFRTNKIVREWWCCSERIINDEQTNCIVEQNTKLSFFFQKKWRDKRFKIVNNWSHLSDR